VAPTDVSRRAGTAALSRLERIACPGLRLRSKPGTFSSLRAVVGCRDLSRRRPGQVSSAYASHGVPVRTTAWGVRPSRASDQWPRAPIPRRRGRPIETALAVEWALVLVGRPPGASRGVPRRSPSVSGRQRHPSRRLGTGSHGEAPHNPNRAACREVASF